MWLVWSSDGFACGRLSYGGSPVWLSGGGSGSQGNIFVRVNDRRALFVESNRNLCDSHRRVNDIKFRDVDAHTVCGRHLKTVFDVFKNEKGGVRKK